MFQVEIQMWQCHPVWLLHCQLLVAEECKEPGTQQEGG